MAAPAVYQDRATKTRATIAANAAVVFAGHRSWRFAHRKRDNHPFFMLEGSPVRQPDGSTAVPTYYVDLHECTCDSHTRGHVACKHMLAVRLWFAAVKRGEIRIPRRMTAGDRVVLEREHAENEAMDVADAADCLLDGYHAEQAKRRAARYDEPDQPWWLTRDGGIVWLQEGDEVRMDTDRTVGGTCEQAGCGDAHLVGERYCQEHLLVDAF